MKVPKKRCGFCSHPSAKAAHDGCVRRANRHERAVKVVDAGSAHADPLSKIR